MRQWLIFFLLGCTVHSAHALKSSYYPDKLKQLLKTGGSDSEIKKTLFEVLASTHQVEPGKSDRIVRFCEKGKSCYKQRELSYREAREHLFGSLHLKTKGKEYFVRDVYCDRAFSKNSGVGPGRIPNHTKINCEHTWPQSRFNGKLSKPMQKSDMHHLYPTDSLSNATRSNYEFAELNEPGLDFCKASRVGTLSGRHFFEPPDKHKGNVARALFYFAVRYKTRISETEERFLRKWHREDPVDQNERIRNQRIFEIQANRNPFIDAPKLVSRIQDF